MDVDAANGLEELSLFTGPATNGERRRGDGRAIPVSPSLEIGAAEGAGMEIVFALGELYAGESAVLSLYMGLSDEQDEVISRILSEVATGEAGSASRVAPDAPGKGDAPTDGSALHMLAALLFAGPAERTPVADVMLGGGPRRFDDNGLLDLGAWTAEVSANRQTGR